MSSVAEGLSFVSDEVSVFCGKV